MTDLVRSRRFDLVHVDSLDLAGYLAACGNIPSCASTTTSSRRSCSAGPRSTRTGGGERTWSIRPVDGATWSATGASAYGPERHRLGSGPGAPAAAAPDARATVVPNGVDLDGVPRRCDRAGGIAYIGGTNPFPNLDALNHFCESILPHVRASCGDVRVRWIGRASADQQGHYRERFGVELTGYVDDVRSRMREAACHIVPLRTGGGTRLKILNAWAMGKPVVSTSIGCEGLAAVEAGNILIRDDPGRSRTPWDGCCRTAVCGSGWAREAVTPRNGSTAGT